MNAADWTFSTYKTGLNLNGVFYDQPNNRLIICHWGSNALIREIYLSDKSVNTMVTTTYRNLDGIAQDNEGNFYVSSWGSNAVYKWGSDFYLRGNTLSLFIQAVLAVVFTYTG